MESTWLPLVTASALAAATAKNYIPIPVVLAVRVPRV